MSWLVSIVVSLLSGAIALFLAGYIATLCVDWYRIPSREGASGYFVVLIALLGGVAGTILGCIVARIVASSMGPSFGKELAFAILSILVVAGVGACISRWLADVPPKIDGHELTLEVEFRFPESFGAEKVPTIDGDWSFTLSSLAGQTRRDYRNGTIHSDAARLDNNRWIVPVEVELFTSRSARMMTLAPRAATEIVGFALPLPACPNASHQSWTEWHPKQQFDGSPWPADQLMFRCRVRKDLD